MQSSHFQHVLVVLVFSTWHLFFSVFRFIFAAQSNAAHRSLWSVDEVTIYGLFTGMEEKKKKSATRLSDAASRELRCMSSTFTTSLTVQFGADRVLWFESLSDPKLSLLDLAATGPKVLFGLCSLAAPPLESAVGRGGPGGRSGPGSEPPFRGVRKRSLLGPGGGAAPVDCEVSAAAVVVVVGTGAVERSRLPMALVVCGGLCVTADRRALNGAEWEDANISGPTEATGVLRMSETWVVRLSFLLQDSQQSLLYPGMEQ